MRQFVCALAIAAVTSGCGASAEGAAFVGPENTCGSTDTCAGGAACVQGTCVATTFDLDGLRVEVRPHANVAFGATTSYLFDPASAGIVLHSDGSGRPFVEKMNPALPAQVQIRGGVVKVNDATALGAGCTLDADRAVPASLTFYRAAPFAGFPLDPVTASTGMTNRLDVDLVPDTYDVYIQPQMVPGCNEEQPLPPVYLSGVSITSGGAVVFPLPEVGTLTGTITGFGPDAPATWKLDLVEPVRGLPVGANVTMTSLGPSQDGYDVKMQIAWPDDGTPILRLAPGDATKDAARPTVFWTLAGPLIISGTQTSPVIGCSVDDLYPTVTSVSLAVLGSDGFTRVPATISVQSTTLSGPDAQNAAIALNGLDTGPNGVFAGTLQQGTFTFRATPVDNGLAITDATFPISEMTDCFCGGTIQLAPKLQLSGALTTPAGEGVPDAMAALGPAQTLPTRTYWSSTHTLPPATTRATSTATNSDGSFVLLVDPGTSDLVVQSDPATGYPWLVKPRLALSSDTQLGGLTIPYPAVLSGVVLDPNGAPVANAEVNAWFPVRDPDASKGPIGTVVKIATTTTDDNGAYVLRMPSSL